MYSDGIGDTRKTPPLEQGQPARKIPSSAGDASDEAVRIPARQAKDEANISADAAEISRYQELVKLHREAYSGVDESDRETRLESVKRRIAEGFYDSDEHLDQLADRVVENSISDQGKAPSLQVVRERSQNDYYERPAVQEKTAENILKSVVPKG